MFKPKNLLIYSNSAGRQPFTVWLDSLDSYSRGRIENRLVRVQLGNYGDYKYLDKGVFELRFDFGGGYRVYFGEDGKDVVVLLVGGNKSSQKKDIDTAIRYWEEYKGVKV